MQRQNFISTLILLICGIAFVCSPAYARFLQTDPVGYGDDIDWYTYVQNDPTDKTDPTGRDFMICQHKDKNGDFSDCKVFRDDSGSTKVYLVVKTTAPDGTVYYSQQFQGYANPQFNDDEGHFSEALYNTAMAAMSVGPGGPKNGQQRGIGGKGWQGDRVWRDAVRKVEQGGTIRDINGKTPTEAEARQLIEEAGGRVDRVEGPHNEPNPHNFDHINYTTKSGAKGTIEIQR